MRKKSLSRKKIIRFLIEKKSVSRFKKRSTKNRFLAIRRIKSTRMPQPNLINFDHDNVWPIAFLILTRFWRNRHQSKALVQGFRCVPVLSKSDQNKNDGQNKNEKIGILPNVLRKYWFKIFWMGTNLDLFIFKRESEKKIARKRFFSLSTNLVERNTSLAGV